MNTNYPMMVRLEGKRVVVVGGGKVAERKITGLLETGADLVVISPEATAEIERLAAVGKLTWRKKLFESADLEAASLIFAATNDRALNEHVASSAGHHQFVNMADDPEDSDFQVPAHFHRGRLTIAVATGGASPTLAREIRNQLERQFDASYEDYLDFLFLKRQWILQYVKEPALKRALLTAITSEAFLQSNDRETDFRRLYNELT